MPHSWKPTFLVFRTPLMISQKRNAAPKTATVVAGISVTERPGTVGVLKSIVVVAPQTFVKTAFTSCPVAG